MFGSQEDDEPLEPDELPEYKRPRSNIDLSQVNKFFKKSHFS